MLRIVLLSVLALTACVGPAGWHRADAGASDLARDRAECRNMGRASGSGAFALYALWKNDQIFSDCMRGRGWTED